jgi:GT2 family glycosyltransferase
MTEKRQAASGKKWDIVIVTFNSANDLLNNWVQHDVSRYVNVIVVDNGSADSSIDLARKAGFHVIESTNVGLSRSNNNGAASGMAPFIAFCNPDIKITMENLKQLETELTNSGGIVSPQLCGTDGEDQPNGRRWPTLPRVIANRLAPESRIARDYLWPNNDPDWVTGAIVCVSRDTFENVIQWSPSFFLYYEDVDLCERARASGIPVSLARNVRVTHAWKRQSKKMLGRTGRLHLRSAVRYYAKYPRRIL